MKTEREAFEVAMFNLAGGQTKNEINPINGKYMYGVMEVMWQVWQASANREGFVLVPVEPTQIMCDEGFSELNTYNRDDTPYGVIKNIYQSMIEVTK